MINGFDLSCLRIQYPLAKSNQSKGLEGVEIGAGSQIKKLKHYFVLFQTLLPVIITQIKTLSFSLPVLDSQIWIIFISVLGILTLFSDIYNL